MWSVLRMRQAHWLIPVISAWGRGVQSQLQLHNEFVEDPEIGPRFWVPTLKNESLQAVGTS